MIRCAVPVYAVLTPRQGDVLQAIARLRAELGLPPSVRELSARLGITGAPLAGHLARLRLLGLVDWVPFCSRTLVLTGAPWCVA